MHVAFAAAVATLLLWPTRRYEKVGLEVIDVPALAPRPLRAEPIPRPKAEPKRKAVFGLSTAAPGDEKSSVAVKPGNTVAKENDTEKLLPGDDKSLPIPTDEYLVTQMPTLLSEFRVPYPVEAKRNRVQGPVTLDLLIDTDGNVRDARVLSGPGSGLNEAALEAVKKIKFRPARVEDKVVSVRIRYLYRFVLEP